MKSRWRIFVLSLAILPLLAPAPGFCSQVQQTDHSCCASQAQLSAPSCCKPGTASQSAIPAQSSDPANAELLSSLLPVSLMTVQQPAMFIPYPGVPPPILLPATILRT
jgi:hypothetical protein